jgi:flagellar hook protein FlgE
VDRNGNMVLGLPLDADTQMPKLDKDGKANIQSMVPIKLDPAIEYTGIEISLNGEVVAMKPGLPTLTPAPNTGWMSGSQSLAEDSLYSGEVVLTVKRDITQQEVTIPGSPPPSTSPPSATFVGGSYNTSIAVPSAAVTIGADVPTNTGMDLKAVYHANNNNPYYTFELTIDGTTYYGSPDPTPPPVLPVPADDPLPKYNLPAEITFFDIDQDGITSSLDSISVKVADLPSSTEIGLKDSDSDIHLGKVTPMLVGGIYNNFVTIGAGVPSNNSMNFKANYDNTTDPANPTYTFELVIDGNTYYGSTNPPMSPPTLPVSTSDLLLEANLPATITFFDINGDSVAGNDNISVQVGSTGINLAPFNSNIHIGNITGALVDMGSYIPAALTVNSAYVNIDPINTIGSYTGQLDLSAVTGPNPGDYTFTLTYGGQVCSTYTLAAADAANLDTVPQTLMFTNSNGIDFEITIDADGTNGIAFNATDPNPPIIALGTATVLAQSATLPQTKTVNVLDTEFVAGTYAPAGVQNTPVGGVTFSVPPGLTGGPDINGKMTLKVTSDATGKYTYTLSTFDVDGKSLELTSTLTAAAGTATFEAPNGGKIEINVGGAGSAGPMTLEIDPSSREQTINLGSAVASKLIVTGYTYQKSGDRVDFSAVEWTPTMNATVNGASTFRMGDISFSVDPADFGSLRNGQVENMTVGQIGPGTSEPEKLGQVAVVTFYNQDGLNQAGEDYYLETINSGEAKAYVPGRSGTGTLLAGALEMSNVDLSREFTEMIVTQRGFQANTRMVTVSDEMLQELINMKR